MRLFDERAGLGSEENIALFRSRLEQQLQSEWTRYRQTNWLKNPYRDLEQYLVPATVTVGSWAAATVLDLWCTTEQCEFVEDTFERICAFMAIVILIFAYSQTHKDAALYTVPVGVALASWFVATVIGSSCNSDSCMVIITIMLLLLSGSTCYYIDNILLCFIIHVHRKHVMLSVGCTCFLVSVWLFWCTSTYININFID